MHKGGPASWLISSHGVFIALAAVGILIVPIKLSRKTADGDARPVLCGAHAALGQVAQVYDPVIEEPIRPLSAAAPDSSASPCGMVDLMLLLVPGGLLLAHGLRSRHYA